MKSLSLKIAFILLCTLLLAVGAREVFAQEITGTMPSNGGYWQLSLQKWDSDLGVWVHDQWITMETDYPADLGEDEDFFDGMLAAGTNYTIPVHGLSEGKYRLLGQAYLSAPDYTNSFEINSEGDLVPEPTTMFGLGGFFAMSFLAGFLKKSKK